TQPAGTITDEYLLNELYQIKQVERSTAGQSAVSPFAYDGDGNRANDDQGAYAYDVLGRLREVWDITRTNLLMRLEYDPLGRLIVRNRSGGSGGRIFYLGARAIHEETLLGGPLRQRCLG